MKQASRWFIALALTALTPGAAAEGADTYGGVGAGLWLPGAGSGASESALDDGFAGELRAGWRLTPTWSLEAAIGGLQAERTLPRDNVAVPKLHSVAGGYLLVTGKATAVFGTGRWQLFGGAGVGSYQLDLHVKEPPNTERRGSEDGIGFHVVGGGRLAVTERSGLALEYRWVDLDDVGIDGAALLLSGDYHY